MPLFPKKFDKKEWLVLIVAVVIYVFIFAVLEYGYGIRFDFGTLLNAVVKGLILVFIIYPVVRGIYLRFNLARFLK